MIKNIHVIFKNAINRATIMECSGLTAEEANLIIPSDGFVRINGDYKVVQIVKSLFPYDSKGTIEMMVHVFLKRVTDNDYYLM